MCWDWDPDPPNILESDKVMFYALNYIITLSASVKRTLSESHLLSFVPFWCAWYVCFGVCICVVLSSSFSSGSHWWVWSWRILTTHLQLIILQSTHLHILNNLPDPTGLLNQFVWKAPANFKLTLLFISLLNPVFPVSPQTTSPEPGPSLPACTADLEPSRLNTSSPGRTQGFPAKHCPKHHTSSAILPSSRSASWCHVSPR